MISSWDLKALKTTKLYSFKEPKKRSDRSRKMRINRNKSGEGEHVYRLFCFIIASKYKCLLMKVLDSSRDGNSPIPMEVEVSMLPCECTSVLAVCSDCLLRC